MVQKSPQQPQKSNIASKSQKKFEGKCYKCGWIGHYAKNCKIKEKINNLNLNESTTSNEECDGTGLCDCTKCQKTINMLTRDQASTLISIIDEMEDLELKQNFLQQLKPF